MKKLLTILLILFTIIGNSQIKNEIESGGTYEKLSSFANGDSSKAVDYIGTIGIKDKDYVWERDTITILAGIFSNRSEIAKEKIAEYCAVSMDTIIGYYMSTGMNQNDATMKYLNNRIIDVQNAASSYCKRINNVQLQVNILLFLGESQAATFNDAVRNFKSDLCSIALKGTAYGDSRDGIMDYIESTGSYTSGGLKSYTMSSDMIAVYGSQDAARLALVQILHNLIINGE